MFTVFDYVLFVVLWFLAITFIILLYSKLKKVTKKYNFIKKEYIAIKTENIKLQHEIYRLTYILPEEKAKKGEKKNETKSIKK